MSTEEQNIPLWGTHQSSHAGTWQPAPPSPWQPPALPEPKKKHTKGWAIGWALAFGVMFLIATFWLVVAVAINDSPQCGDDSVSGSTYHVCVTPSSGYVSVQDITNN